jgi:peptide/nickel transport system substrate-binding protein
MSRTYLLTAILLLLSLFCFGLQEPSAQSQPVRGGTLTAGFGADIVGTDPHVTSGAISAVVLNHVFDRLIGYDENLDLVPILAERWEASPDLKSITFYLRQGRFFHNGREMVAEDVKYSLERIKDPKTGNPRRSAFDTIEAIEVIDKYTVRLQLKQPDSTLFSTLAYTTPIVAIVPREEVEKQGGVMKIPVGTGPYKFVEWKPDRYVLLERFEQYKPVGGPMNGYGGERHAYLDKIKFVPIPEESVAIMALLNKEIDFLAHVPFKDIEKFRNEYAKRGIQTDEMAGLSWYGLFLGCDKPITKDVKFRQACAYAIDRNVVSQAATRGNAIVNSSFVAMKNVYYTPAHAKWYPKDLEKAKQLLKESGYQGQEIPLLTTKRYAAMYDQAVAFQAELAAAGVQTKLEVLDWPVLLDRMYSGNYQLISFGVSAKPDPALAYMEVKYAGFEEQYPRLKELREKAGLTLDTGVRKKLFEEAHEVIYQGVPAIICYYQNHYSASWNYVKGYKAYATNQARFWNVWLDKK